MTENYELTKAESSAMHEEDLYRQVAQAIEEPHYTHTLRVRLTEHQWQVLKARALVLGQSTSEFVRRKVFDKR